MVDIIFIAYILTGLMLMWYDRDSKHCKKHGRKNVIYVDFVSGRQSNDERSRMKKTI